MNTLLNNRDIGWKLRAQNSKKKKKKSWNLSNNLLGRSNTSRKIFSKIWLFDESLEGRQPIYLNTFPTKLGIFFKMLYWWFVTTDTFIFPVRKALPMEVQQLVAQWNYWLKSHSQCNFISFSALSQGPDVSLRNMPYFW